MSFQLPAGGVDRSLWRTAVGIALALCFVLVTERYVQHDHGHTLGSLSGEDGRRALLIVGVMTVHSAGEGIAVGDAFADALRMNKPGSDVEASEPGIFAEVVSISSTRSAGVSDSAYFIKSIELRSTFDLFLGARVASGGSADRIVVLPQSSVDHRPQRPRGGRARGRVRGSDRRWSVIVAEAARRRWLRWRRGY